MSVVSYKGVRDTAVQAIKQAFAFRKGIVVEAHPGRFDEDEVKRLALRAPAVLTSLMAIGDQPAEDTQDLTFVTWVIVRADNKDPLFDGALGILSLLLPTLKGLDASWSFGGGKKFEAKNLFTSSAASLNVSLWAVSWDWSVRGVQSFEDGGIPLPDSLAPFEGTESVVLVGDQEELEKLVL